MTHKVTFSPEAQDDLAAIYDYIAPRGGFERAWSFVQRIEATCLSLAQFPERGTSRDNLRPGLRVVGMERRVTIAFHIQGDMVVIDRILYAGRDLGQVSDKV